MPYAEGRTYYDADSHLMETRDWLVSYADPDMRERLMPLDLGTAGRLADRAVAHAADRRINPESVAVLEANLMTAKGWEALGAFDPAERSRALDLLGFERQLIFTTFAMSQFFGIFQRGKIEPDVMYGGARAHNRAIADFCSRDKRLLGVGFVPLEDPELAEKAIVGGGGVRLRRDPYPVGAAAAEVADPSGLRSGVGALPGSKHPVHASRRRQRPGNSACVP